MGNQKTKSLVVLALAILAVMTVFGGQAFAFPTYTSPCGASNCHVGGPAVNVVATPVSNNGVTATYSISVTGGTPPGPYGWAAFAGSTRVGGAAAASGQLSVAVGATYTVFGVSGPTNTDGVGSITLSPVAPPVDTTPPTTVANPSIVPTYTGTAHITLVATDNAGGSGVAHTYYRINGGTTQTGTSVTVSAPGSYTLQFWSVDVAGNVEAANTATFVVVPVPDVTPPTTVASPSIVATYFDSATIHLVATDNPGGSGVANTYFVLNNGATQTGTTVLVSAPGSYTLQYWSVDFAGNVETTKQASFAVVVNPTPITSVMTIRSSVYALRLGHKFTLSGTLTPADVDPDETVRIQVLYQGHTRWNNIAMRVPISSVNANQVGSWAWGWKSPVRGTFKFRARFDGEPGQSAAVSPIVTVRVQ